MLDTFRGATAEALVAVAEEMKIRKTKEVFLLFSMGSQFDHLIKQSLERLGVFCLVADPASVKAADVSALKPVGIIISGGPASVHAEPPPFDGSIFDLGIPILGICLGFQMWAGRLGLTIKSAERREFGVHELFVGITSDLFQGVPSRTTVLESHGDMIEDGQHRIQVLASTDNAPIAAARQDHLWGVQFHPEVSHTDCGSKMLENFCFSICGAKDRFPAQAIAEQKVSELRDRIGGQRVLLALSGGSDSSTVAYLLKEALGQQVREQVLAVYIRGIDRPDDEEYVRQYFSDFFRLRVIDATTLFLDALQGKIAMHDKRVAMRGVYKDILEKEARLFGASFIAQGTLYTDVSESGGGYSTGARKAQIKLHHNVSLGFNLPELTPLIDCVKDSGRNIGRAISVPEALLTRHPFPGPGLVIRIDGEVTATKLAIARRVDAIYIEELRRDGFYHQVWQAGAHVGSMTTTCTKGDDACSGVIVLLWAVNSVNGFTAHAADLPYDFWQRVDRRITNEVREVGATFTRNTGKPPATIEIG